MEIPIGYFDGGQGSYTNDVSIQGGVGKSDVGNKTISGRNCLEMTRGGGGVSVG